MQFVIYEKENKIVTITMNRPERLNAWGRQMRRDLAEAWTRFKDDPDALVAIFTGTGKAFCAGVDAKEWAERGRGPVEDPLLLNDPYGTAELKPVIAAINGYCLGAGFNLLAMRADIRIAAESATFGLPEVARGIMTLCTPFAHLRLPTGIMMELALTGDPISAHRAYELGIVNKVVPDGELMSAARAMAERIAQNSPLAVQLTKQSLLKSTEVSEAARILETYLFRDSSTSEDVLEGMRAFAERRAPVWKGR